MTTELRLYNYFFIIKLKKKYYETSKHNFIRNHNNIFIQL
jgi:hypothetical protein